MVKERYTEAEKRLMEAPELEKPDLKKIVCRDCFLRAENRRVGKSVIDGAQLSCCEVYPVQKPDEVLWENADCQYYIGDDE